MTYFDELIEPYRDYLKDFGLTGDEEAELILSIHRVIEKHLDECFNNLT